MANTSNRGECTLKGPRFVYWRNWIQLAFVVVMNSYFFQWAKGYCVPSLNCWSCPGAIFGCPAGALQHHAGSAPILWGRKAWYAILPLYVVGTIVVFCALFGRMACGWMCPFGWVQDLLTKMRRKHWNIAVPLAVFLVWGTAAVEAGSAIIPFSWEALQHGLALGALVLGLYGLAVVRSRHLKIPKWLGYFRYVVLVVLVGIVPYLTNEPWFCKLCPQGALQGGILQPIFFPELRATIGTMWWIKQAILVAFLVLAVFVRRPFCGAACPLGAIFSLFNRWSVWQTVFDADKCINCLQCVRECPAGIDPRTEVSSHACIGCLECTKCPFDAIHSQPIWASRSDLQTAGVAEISRNSGCLCADEVQED